MKMQISFFMGRFADFIVHEKTYCMVYSGISSLNNRVILVYI